MDVGCICVCECSDKFPLSHAGCKAPKKETDIDWKKYNETHRQWLADNPDAEYEGWVSI